MAIVKRLRTTNRLLAEKRGGTALEFAFIAPVFLTILMGGMDFGHTLYVQTVIQGVVQKAARNSALENGAQATGPGSQAQIDSRVRGSIAEINNQANVQITRRFYRTFSTAAAAQAETFTDNNANGTCDNNEPYTDANRNNSWDSDGADAGQGGARDVTVYKVVTTYPSMFPTRHLINFVSQLFVAPDKQFVKGAHNVNDASLVTPLGTTTITAQTVLGNQPYGDQGTYAAPVTRNCI
jgi:Flp pilus assembly protein TadG